MPDSASDPNDTTMLKALLEWMNISSESNRQGQLDRMEVQAGSASAPGGMTPEESLAAEEAAKEARIAELMKKYQQ